MSEHGRQGSQCGLGVCYWVQHLPGGCGAWSRSNLLKPHFLIRKMGVITRLLLWKAELMLHIEGAVSHCKEQGTCSGGKKGLLNPTEQQHRSEVWVKMTKRGHSVMAPKMFVLLMSDEGQQKMPPQNMQFGRRNYLSYNHLQKFHQVQERCSGPSLFLPESRR